MARDTDDTDASSRIALRGAHLHGADVLRGIGRDRAFKFAMSGTNPNTARTSSATP